jgi:hypothetical protein
MFEDSHVSEKITVSSPEDVHISFNPYGPRYHRNQLHEEWFQNTLLHV